MINVRFKYSSKFKICYFIRHNLWYTSSKYLHFRRLKWRRLRRFERFRFTFVKKYPNLLYHLMVKNYKRYKPAANNTTWFKLKSFKLKKKIKFKIPAKVLKKASLTVPIKMLFKVQLRNKNAFALYYSGINNLRLSSICKIASSRKYNRIVSLLWILECKIPRVLMHLNFLANSYKTRQVLKIKGIFVNNRLVKNIHEVVPIGGLVYAPFNFLESYRNDFNERYLRELTRFAVVNFVSKCFFLFRHYYSWIYQDASNWKNSLILKPGPRRQSFKHRSPIKQKISANSQKFYELAKYFVFNLKRRVPPKVFSPYVKNKLTNFNYARTNKKNRKTKVVFRYFVNEKGYFQLLPYLKKRKWYLKQKVSVSPYYVLIIHPFLFFFNKYFVYFYSQKPEINYIWKSVKNLKNPGKSRISIKADNNNRRPPYATFIY